MELSLKSLIKQYAYNREEKRHQQIYDTLMDKNVKLRFKNDTDSGNLKIYSVAEFSTHEQMEFLSKLGYQLKSWQHYWEDEAFPMGITCGETSVLVALKEGQVPSAERILDKVFMREIMQVFKNNLNKNLSTDRL